MIIIFLQQNIFIYPPPVISLWFYIEMECILEA